MPMPTKRAILSELTRDELRANLDFYEFDVYDRRVRAQLIDALAGSGTARVDPDEGSWTQEGLLRKTTTGRFTGANADHIDDVLRRFYRPSEETGHVVRDSDNIKYWAEGEPRPEEDLLDGRRGHTGNSRR